MEPLIEQLATELKGKLKVVKVDVDEAPVVSSRFGIRSVPTFVVFVDGKETARAVGAVPLERLRSLVATV
jgi:thioredoxin-like negative regulator of GroEL